MPRQVIQLSPILVRANMLKQGCAPRVMGSEIFESMIIRGSAQLQRAITQPTHQVPLQTDQALDFAVVHLARRYSWPAKSACCPDPSHGHGFVLQGPVVPILLGDKDKYQKPKANVVWNTPQERTP